MPLPWKKAKVSRISRIVADLQPPKRGNSSLVVETGFPTSLVDLFVKNRDRLKKPIKKRKKQQQQQERQRVIEEPVISDPIPLSSSRGLSVEHVYTDNKDQGMDNLEGTTRNKNSSNKCEDQNLDSDNKVVKGCDGADGLNDKNGICVLMAILKMFVVVVLALSTNRLAVGITLSASFLIFLEYVGKHVVCCLKPCLGARMAFQILFQRVLILFRWRFSSPSSERTNGGGDDDVGDVIQNIGSRSYVEEIQVVKPRIDMVSGFEDNERVENKSMRELLSWDKRWGSPDEDGDIICEKQHGRTCRMRRTIIKKLVPKKLRAINKGRKGKERESKEVDLLSEVSGNGGEDNLWRNEVMEEQHQQQGKLRPRKSMEEREGERGNYKRDHKKEEEEEVEEKEVCSKEGNEQFEPRNSPTSSVGLHTESDKVIVEERVDFERGANSGCLVLFLIILAGLVGGRILALLLTVASCSMVKLVWRRRKCLNHPEKLSPTSVRS